MRFSCVNFSLKTRSAEYLNDKHNINQLIKNTTMVILFYLLSILDKSIGLA